MATMPDLDLAAIKEEHQPADWDEFYCGECRIKSYPCLPYLLADRAEAAEAVMRGTLAALEDSACTFWACDGPDAPFVSMKTCSNCAEVQLLRAALYDQPEGGDHA